MLTGRGMSETMIRYLWRQPSLSKRIFKCFELSFSYQKPFAQDHNAVMLFPAKVLRKLFFYSGVAVFSLAINRIIEGDRLRRIEEELGGNILDFVRAHKQIGNTDILPKVLPLFQEGTLKTELSRVGFRHITASLKKNDTQFCKRFFLKVPIILRRADKNNFFHEIIPLGEFWFPLALEIFPECRKFVN